jgi:hypothetical protein
MRKLANSLCLVGLLLVAARAVPQSRHIHENVDPYTGLRTLFLEVSTHTCHGDPSPGMHDPDVHLLFMAEQNQNHTVSYFISPELDQASYTLGLRPQGTMDTLIDGVVGTFSTPAGSTTTNRYSGNHSYLHETIPFSVSQADLASLSTAESFQFRINGQRQEVQRCTDAKQMRELPEFLDAARAYAVPGLDDSQQTPIVEQMNPSTHLKTLTLDNIATQACPGDPALGPNDADIHLAISADQRSDGGVWYFISTDVLHGPPLALRRGDKLHTQMDKAAGAFNTINGSILSYAPDAAGRPIAHETTAFHVHQADLIALSKASVLELAIDTPTGAVRRCAHSDQFKYLGEFISAAASYEPSHLAAAPPPPSHQP